MKVQGVHQEALTSNCGTERRSTRYPLIKKLTMSEPLSYPKLMGATIDSLVEETQRTGKQVSITVNYSSKETQFIFTQILKTGLTLETQYIYKMDQEPLHGLTHVFTAYYHLIKVVEEMP